MAVMLKELRNDLFYLLLIERLYKCVFVCLFEDFRSQSTIVAYQRPTSHIILTPGQPVLAQAPSLCFSVLHFIYCKVMNECITCNFHCISFFDVHVSFI